MSSSPNPMIPQQQAPPPTRGSSFMEFWRDPATSQKLMALGLLVASLAVGGYGVVLLMRGDEETLYRNLPEQEAAQTVQKLNGSGIPAHLGADGRSVIVSGSHAEQARLALASEGYPATGGVGFELFDGTGFGMTDFLEQVNYRRALEGELARTIASLDEVDVARVHLALPRESIYADETEAAKASVSLRLHRSLEPRSIQAVVNLTASAVEGLKPEGVVVVDSYGRTLYSGTTDALGDSLSDDQLALKSNIEQELASKAVAILEPLVGPGRVRAKASVAMDFDRAEETIESFDPEGSVVRSQRLDEKKQGGTGVALARGIPGTRTNPPEGDAAEPDPPPEDNVISKSELINYEVSKRVRHVLTPVGRVARRSVAVVVDDAVTTTEQEGVQTEQRTPYSEEEVTRFNELVVAALGLDVQAGDVVTVQNISFDSPRTDEPLAEPTLLEKLQPYLPLVTRNLSWIGLLAGFYLLMFRPVMKKINEPLSRPVALPEPAAATALAPGQPIGPSMASAAAFGALPASTSEPVGLLTRAQQVSEQSPEAASHLVRDWLDEDRTD